MAVIGLVNRLFLLLLLTQFDTALPSEFEWSYDNTDNWGIDSPECDGEWQSPIHLRIASAISIPIPAIKFGYYDIPLADNITLTNNGHSVEFDVPVTINGQRPFISGGLMKNKFEAESVHFHWGSAKSKGSEHVIDYRRFDVEMHIVHKNVNYESIDEASQNKDGLAVLAIMFKMVYEPDRYYPGINQILNKFPNISNYGESVNLDDCLTLGQLLGDLNTKEFYTYSGSLTTPNCAEAVTWHVFPEPLPVSQEQIAKFWSIRQKNGEILTNNNRLIQRRNNRPVFYRIATRAFVKKFFNGGKSINA